jgi:hypothetical protein
VTRKGSGHGGDQKNGAGDEAGRRDHSRDHPPQTPRTKKPPWRGRRSWGRRVSGHVK